MSLKTPLETPDTLLRTVLLVEDNVLDTRLLRELLADAQSLNATERYEIVNAQRLQEALEVLAERSFDVVLLDLSLPDSFGLETFDRLFEHAADIPIVVLTGLDDDALVHILKSYCSIIFKASQP